MLTACVSCHLPQLGWAVNDPRSRNDSGKLTSRKSPTLLGVGHLGSVPNGWDGRNVSLEAQAKASIATGSMSMRETETPVNVEVIEQRIRAIPAYVERFRTALPEAPINIDAMVKAIAAYEAAFEPGPAPFDRWVEGDAAAIRRPSSGGLRCSTARRVAPPATSAGASPTIGSTISGCRRTTSAAARGQGRPANAVRLQDAVLAHGRPRAPYMHNGSLADLDAVIRHYQKGGLDRPSRSPMMMPIELDDGERADLVAFLATLTGTPEGEAPPKLPGE